MRALESALTVDQIDATNLVCMEHLSRRGQLIEHYHKERHRVEVERASGKKGVMEMEGGEVFMGMTGEEGILMISPQLVAHVSKEMERQGSIDKASRKAREERQLRRKDMG